MALDSKDESNPEDGEIDYEGVLIATPDELSKSRIKNKLLKEEIWKLKGNKTSLVDSLIRARDSSLSLLGLSATMI